MKKSSTAQQLFRIGVFYDGNFFLHVSNFYNYVHERQSRLSISGIHQFIRQQVAEKQGVEVPLCQIVDAHYFRGRLSARDASERENSLYFDRVFDDILMSQNVTTHYLPVRPNFQGGRQEKGIDVWLALEAFELAFYKRFDVLVLITSDGDYVPLVRKLNTLGTRVMVLYWDFEYSDQYGNKRTTKTSHDLLEEVTYPIAMHEVIDGKQTRNDALVNDLFVPRVDRQKVYHLPNEEDDIMQVSEILSLKNGFGFIKYPNNNLFFHYTSVIDSDFADLQPGDPVEFRITRNAEGYDIATDVRVLRN